MLFLSAMWKYQVSFTSDLSLYSLQLNMGLKEEFEEKNTHVVYWTSEQQILFFTAVKLYIHRLNYGTP
jgi:hypothetical protein